MENVSLRAHTCALWDERNPALDTSAMEVVAQVRRISSLLDLAVDQVHAAEELTSAEVDLLVPLRYADDAVTAIRLAELLGMSRAGVSKTLAKMERRGLISRTPNPADRRSALIAMTDRGIKAIDEQFPRELEAHGRLLAGLGGDRAAVVAVLKRLAESMAAQIDVPR